MNYHDYKTCIDACLNCAAVCQHCASMDLKESGSHMKHCAQLDMECAAACYAAAQLMSLGSEHAKEMCRLCAKICIACAEECEKHDDEHCRECAAACRKCAAECGNM